MDTAFSVLSAIETITSFFAASEWIDWENKEILRSKMIEAYREKEFVILSTCPERKCFLGNFVKISNYEKMPKHPYHVTYILSEGKMCYYLGSNSEFDIT